MGLIELTAQANRLLEFSGYAYESFIAVTLAYAFLNFVVMLCSGILGDLSVLFWYCSRFKNGKRLLGGILFRLFAAAASGGKFGSIRQPQGYLKNFGMQHASAPADSDEPGQPLHRNRLILPQRDQMAHAPTLDEEGRLVCRPQTSRPPKITAELTVKAAQYRLWHSKAGGSAYLSQLELQAVLDRALRRAAMRGNPWAVNLFSISSTAVWSHIRQYRQGSKEP